MDSPVIQPENPYEASRRAENMLRLGTVAQVRLNAPARCRVRTGGLLTDWLPWVSVAAGGEAGRLWRAPVAGEQCLVLAPGGDLLQAVVLPGLFSDALPPGSDQAGVLRVEMPVAIELVVGESAIEITPDAIRLRAGGATLELQGGLVRAAPDVVAGRISLIGHVHGGVQSGPSRTGRPE